MFAVNLPYLSGSRELPGMRREENTDPCFQVDVVLCRENLFILCHLRALVLLCFFSIIRSNIYLLLDDSPRSLHLFLKTTL